MNEVSLFRLASELEAIAHDLRVSEGELTPELEAKLDACNLAMKDKCEGLIKWTISLEGKQDAIEKEIARLTKMKTSVANLHDRLQEYVHTSMIRADIQKIELPTMEISVVKNPPSLDLVNYDSVPAEYVTFKQEKVIDRRAILADLKAGKVIPCARLNTSKTHLKVK